MVLLGAASMATTTTQTPSGTREDSGWILRLTPEDRESFLQALNELRLGAWEQLGRPDPRRFRRFASELTQYPALVEPEIASRFQGRLMSEESLE